MTTFDPQTVLDSLEAEYAARVTAIRRDLAGSHSADSAEQAGERQKDEVLQALLVDKIVGKADRRGHDGCGLKLKVYGCIRL